MRKIILTVLSPLLSLSTAFAADESAIARGRYLSLIGGCNDCHTSGFAPSGGTVPESEWLKGDSIGWRGPWGTTYPINLRNLAAKLTKEQWVTFMQNSKARPPMPAYITSKMPVADLEALYEFIHHLGAAGTETPSALPPGIEPTTPYFNFTPVEPKKEK